MNKQQFVPPHPLDTAVLFLVFNRPDTTKQVFKAIREAKPPRLYIAADGARKEKNGEKEKARQVREIATQADWDCEVKTLFRDKNLGCKYAVSSAIEWFFDNEDMGIILEDDCLPSQSFFWFCEELLDRYKDDMRIWNIGGYKLPYLKGDKNSYNFSRYTHIWGWATWANRWRHYDVDMSKLKINKNILHDYEFFREDYENESRAKILDKVASGEIDTWDYQWNFTIRVNNGLSIRPKVNLIDNIGFGAGATHTTGNNKKIEKNTAVNIDFPIQHPNFIMAYKNDDKLFGRKHIDNRFLARVKGKLSGK